MEDLSKINALENDIRMLAINTNNRWQAVNVLLRDIDSDTRLKGMRIKLDNMLAELEDKVKLLRMRDF